ncbi:MAG: hypothetical protein ABIX01_17465 [Chitinophagaceae bacterium]
MPLYFYFLLTLLIELPFVLFWLRKDWKEALLVGFLLNLLTWPTLVLLLSHTNININLLEIGVALVESTGYWVFFKRKWWHCFVAGFVVNGISYGIGVWLF